MASPPFPDQLPFLYPERKKKRKVNRHPINLYTVNCSIQRHLSLLFSPLLPLTPYSDPLHTVEVPKLLAWFVKAINMNGYREDNPHCYFHPKALVVGICALCLRERLLELAAKQDQHGPVSKDSSSNRFFRTLSRPPVITLPKVFSLGSFLHLLDHSRHPRSKDDNDDDGSIGSLEDSFISIKFEDNGRASWHQKAASVDAAVPAAARNVGAAGTSGKEANKSVVELPKRGAGAMRWRKRIGHLLQLARWKRSSKTVSLEGGGGGSGKGINRRRSWMRSLTRRTTATSTAFAVSVD